MDCPTLECYINGVEVSRAFWGALIPVLASLLPFLLSRGGGGDAADGFPPELRALLPDMHKQFKTQVARQEALGPLWNQTLQMLSRQLPNWSGGGFGGPFGSVPPPPIPGPPDGPPEDPPKDPIPYSFKLSDPHGWVNPRQPAQPPPIVTGYGGG